MKATRSLTMLTGVALLGLGASLISRALADEDDDARGGLRGPGGERNRDASVPYRHGTRIEKAFTIERSAQDLYDYWRDLSRLPTIMSHLERVEELGDASRSHWVAAGPAGFRAEWDAEIIDDTPGERIAWRSTGGSVPNAGSVMFSDAPGGRGTELRVEMEWEPPAGPLGKSFAHLFGGDPGLMVESDLRRFKATMEAGYHAVNGTDVTA